MNNYGREARNRGQTLLIVEGHHEKDRLLWLILKCFPEISITPDNIWIYGTNLFLLHDDIAKEYGLSWIEDTVDIDLPFVISKKVMPNALRYKDDFTNILLVFDYERHETNFSEAKVRGMQRRFSDATDMGKLFINYPMIESYKHLKEFPDPSYRDRKIPVNLQPGHKYKALVSKESAINLLIDFPHRLDDLLNKKYAIHDATVRHKYCSAILNLSSAEHLPEKITSILSDSIEAASLSTLKYTLNDWISSIHYAHERKSYWQHTRKILTHIIFHNICKANWIQNNQYDISEDAYKNHYQQIDLNSILEIQNNVSRDITSGYIWVLNTCVFFVADYNFALLHNQSNPPPYNLHQVK